MSENIEILSLEWLMIIYGFTSRWKIFHLYGDVTIAGEGLQNLGLCSALRAFEQGGIFIVLHLLWQGTSVFTVSSKGPPHLVASSGGLLVPEGLYSPVANYFSTCFMNWTVKKKSKFCKFISKRRIISLRHSSILRRIWLNFMASCFVFIRRLFQFSHFFPRISNFFDLSITEETLVVEMRTWCIKIVNVLVLHFNPWVEASAGGLLVPEGFYSPVAEYFGTCFKIRIWIELSRKK
jgi:hypothetical protein